MNNVLFYKGIIFMTDINYKIKPNKVIDLYLALEHGELYYKGEAQSILSDQELILKKMVVGCLIDLFTPPLQIAETENPVNTNSRTKKPMGAAINSREFI